MEFSSELIQCVLLSHLTSKLHQAVHLLCRQSSLSLTRFD
jgi:hypothetical protein